MNRFRDQFFSSSAFARDQDRGARGRYLLNHPKHFLHDVRASDDRPAIDFAAHRLSQRSTLFFFAPSLDAGSHGGADVLVLKRLADATERAFFPGGDCSIESSIGGNHHDYRLRIELQKFFERA